VKVRELLNESPRDIDDIRNAYHQWKKLCNMPVGMMMKFLLSDKGREAIKSAGITKHELEKIGQQRLNNSAMRAIIRMRDRPLPQWEAIDIGWMYRQIAYIKKLKKRPGLLYNTDADGKKIPTDKLYSLWAYGHIPQELTPGKFGVYK